MSLFVYVVYSGLIGFSALLIALGIIRKSERVRRVGVMLLMLHLLIGLHFSSAKAAERVNLATYETTYRTVEQGDFVVLTEPTCGASSCSYLMTISHKKAPGKVIFEGRVDSPFVKIIQDGNCLDFACQKDLEFLGDISRASTPCVPLRLCKERRWKDYTNDFLLEGPGLDLDQISPDLEDAELAKLVFLALYYQGKKMREPGAMILLIKDQLTPPQREWVEDHWNTLLRRMIARTMRVRALLHP
jgi:hypothetical protein